MNPFELLQHARWKIIDTIQDNEKKQKQSLGYYFIVCYLDLNGAGNSGQPFNLKMRFIAPGLISYINSIASKLDLSNNELEPIFIEATTPIWKSMIPYKIPLKPEMVWPKLKSHLEKQSHNFSNHPK